MWFSTASDEDAVANAGYEYLKASMRDPSMIKEAAMLLKDPENVKLIQQLANDPKFKQQVQRLKEDPTFQSTLDTAKAYLNNPNSAKQMTDVELGLSELAKTARNPKFLAEALQDLKDPEIAAEVIVF